MKIAIVIENLDPTRGGRETSTAQIAAGLAHRGCDVTVLCQRSKWDRSDVKVKTFGRRGILRVQRLSNFIRSVDSSVQEDKYDIVHTTLPILSANVYQPRSGTIPGQIAGARRRWKLLGPLRAGILELFNLSRRKLAHLERQIADDENVLCLPVSEMVAGELAHYYSRRRNVRVVYNAVDIPQIDPQEWAQWRQKVRFELGVSQDDPVFICVAKNFPLKGVAETIRSFAKWGALHYGQVNARLVIVGRELVEGYERLASMLGVGKQVSFVPATNEIFRWYAAANACILLSWYDPCSRTVLEATRLGLPSITTVHNGAAEILSGGAGIVVSSPKDTRAIVAALDELADPQRRADYVDASRSVGDLASMDNHVEQLLKAYAEVPRRP